MKLLVAAFADEITQLDNEQYDVHGARHTVMAESFPVVRNDLRMAMLVRLFGYPDELDDIEITLVWVNQETGQKFGLRDEIVFPEKVHNSEKNILRIRFRLDDVEFSTPGRYVFSIFFDGDCVGSLMIEAREI